MNRRSWTLVGVLLVAIGLGVYGLGVLGEEAAVRQVGAVVADPAAHTSGTFTVVGLPQPALVPVQAPEGPRMVPNPGHVNETVHVQAWTQDGRLVHSVHTLSVRIADGQSHWTHTNVSRYAGTDTEATPAITTMWTLHHDHTVVPIEGFEHQGAPRAWLLGVYTGVLRDPLQPKPSQFMGRLMTHLPDGTPLPDGALLYEVETLTIGCSSKFLPAEFQDQPEGLPETAEGYRPGEGPPHDGEGAQYEDGAAHGPAPEDAQDEDGAAHGPPATGQGPDGEDGEPQAPSS